MVDLASERAKFIEDATRLAEDVSGNQTFHAVKPLLNFWGAFTPSNEVGLSWPLRSDCADVPCVEERNRNRGRPQGVR